MCTQMSVHPYLTLKKKTKAIIFREYFADGHILPFLELLLGTENKPREL